MTSALKQFAVRSLIIIFGFLRPRIALSCLALLAVPSSTVFAACLDDAAAFAERVCGEISNRGSSQLITGSGQLTAEAKGLIAKMLGSAEGTANVSEAVSTYENVARDELAKEHANIRDCKSHMVEVAVKRACKQAENDSGSRNNSSLFSIGENVGPVNTDSNFICGSNIPVLMRTGGSIGAVITTNNLIYGADCSLHAVTPPPAPKGP